MVTPKLFIHEPFQAASDLMTGQLSQLHARLLSLARDSSKGEVDHEEAAHIAAAEISDAAYPLSQRLLAGAQGEGTCCSLVHVGSS
jgi:hypothetical protein